MQEFWEDASPKQRNAVPVIVDSELVTPTVIGASYRPLPFVSPQRPSALGWHRQWLVAVGTFLAVVMIGTTTLVAAQTRLTGAFVALAGSAAYPAGVVPTPIPPPSGGPDGPLYPYTHGSPRTFLCAALPWARFEQTMMDEDYLQTPGPHDLAGVGGYWHGPLPHPWYVSVLLAQWAVEHGWNVPDYTGWNWGNSSGIPGFPSIGGTSTPGSPLSFAYGRSALMGVEIHESFVRMGFYRIVFAAFPNGPIAQATALGESPWDAAHYTRIGSPGSALRDVIRAWNLTRFDDPHATC